jgi:pectin methylesterase-like acyl-CoA thioesterase
VILAGDSTVAPRTGYGDAFCGLFLWNVECVNLGRGGRSTMSFRADGSWDRLLARLREPAAGRPTWVLIQFGHNDQPGKPGRSTDLETEYPRNLERFIEEVRVGGALPVLVTPLARRQFAEDGRYADNLAPWADSMRRVARERRVALLDLHAASSAAVAAMGSARADTLAMASAPHRDFDRTHLGPAGAALFARLLARELAATVPELAAHLVVGAIEPSGRIERPQLSETQAEGFSYRAVLGDWDPLSDPLVRGPTPRPDLVVDAAAQADGRRIFATVQSAVSEAIRLGTEEGRRGRIHIGVRPGTYRELVFVPEAPVAVTLHGEGPDASGVRIVATLDARISGEQYAHTFGAGMRDAHPAVAAMFRSVAAQATVGTFGSSVVWVRNAGFQARNLTIENAHNKDRGDVRDHSQAVALRVEDADRAQFENVRLLGFQDTLLLAAGAPKAPPRAFFHRSYIEGDMDFIFGEATAYFLETEVRTLGDRAVSYALAPSTHYQARHGFVFEHCRFTHDGTPNALAGTFKLARQWYRAVDAVGKVAILRSRIGAHIDALRPWADWSIGTPRHRPVQYDSDEHWERLRAAGTDPVRDLGYPPRPVSAEPFLAEFRNTGPSPAGGGLAALDRVGLDVVEVDVLAQSREIGKADEALGIHGVGGAVEPGGNLVVVEKRVQESALVPGAVADRADHVQVGGAVAVDLAVHPEGLGQVRDLEARPDAASQRHAGAQDVAGTRARPRRAREEPPGERLGPQDRDAQLAREPAVGLDRVLLHRLLEPGEAELLDLAPDVERVRTAVPVVAVEHEGDIRPDRLAHGRAGPHVHFRIRGEGHGWEPRVQLDPAVAAPDQLLGKTCEILGSGKATRLLIAGHRAGVGRDLLAEAADELVHRQAQFAPGPVPQRLLDDGERAVGELRRAAPLAVGERAPQPLAVEGILPDERLSHERVEHVGSHDLRRAERVAFGTVLGADAQHRKARCGLAVGERAGMPGRVAADARGMREDVDRERFDIHRESPHSMRTLEGADGPQAL